MRVRSVCVLCRSRIVFRIVVFERAFRGLFGLDVDLSFILIPGRNETCFEVAF